MGEIVKSERDLLTSYEGLNILKNSGAFNACGYGVRDRDTETVIDKTYICTKYQPIGGGVYVKYVKFRIGTGTTSAGAIVAAWWYRDSGSDIFYLITSKDFDKPAAHWLSGTEYMYEMDDPIRLSMVLGRTYYMSIFSEFATFDATDTGNLTNGVRVDFDAAGGGSSIPVLDQDDDEQAVSCESWGDPASWVSVVDGGGIEEENTDWQNSSYCTGTMTGVANVYGAGSATAGAVDEYIAIDLGAGITPSVSYSGDEFPDYANSGIRAVSNVDVLMTLASGGIIAVLSSETDTVAMPDVSGGDWTLLGSESYSVGTPVTLSINIPALARWILIIELGSSITDAVDTVTIDQVKTKVTDGNFPVSFLNLYHKCWTKNAPIEDTVYKVTCYNSAGAQSEAGDPFTNRENKD